MKSFDLIYPLDALRDFDRWRYRSYVCSINCAKRRSKIKMTLRTRN